MFLAPLLVSLAILSAEPAAAPQLGEYIRAMIAEDGPLVIEERKGWGDQVRIFDGFKVEGHGLKRKLVVRKKPVDHGLWKHYRLWIEDPRRDLVIEFPRLEYVADEGIHFAIDILAHVKAYADMRQFNNGVRLFSAATEASFDLRTRVEGLITVHVEKGKWTPDLLLAPKVSSVRLELPNIDVQRFGKIKGKLAQETGDHFRRLLEDRLNDEEEKVSEKINRAIAKKWSEGTLRISTGDFLAQRP